MGRFDAVGFFWDEPPALKRGEAPRVLAPIPESDWRPPAYFPNLSTAPCISVDTETWDPELLIAGPGWARNVGHIVGVSIAVPGHKWYFPMRHTIQPEYNLDPATVLAWLRDTLGDPKQPKIGANLTYDLGWLAHEGVTVQGELIDVQFAEALLNEDELIGLEHLAVKYLDEGKDSPLLYKWASDSYGGTVGPKQRANIYRCPPSIVGPYAESDADLPLRLAPILIDLLQRENLMDLFRMENRLIRLLIAMRQLGVRVDIPKAEKLYDDLGIRILAENKKLHDMVGFEVNVNAGDSIAKAFDQMNFGYGKTASGKASFTKVFLQNADHPLAEQIVEVRKLQKLQGTFIKSYILEKHVNGRIHCSFISMREDDNGTRSGRFASADPNLQNIPSRDEILAPLIRGLFVPDIGHKQWRKYDYSQIEYRFLIHYAVGASADLLRAHFNQHPDTDYHELVLEMVAPYAGWDITESKQRKAHRKPLKTINFGLIYGMGKPKLTRSLGLSSAEGKKLFQAYHTAIPFARDTMDHISNEASRTGIVTTIMGRRSRFNLWEPDGYGLEFSKAMPYPLARAAYRGPLRRAYLHKALNRKLQGSAADMMKKAMDDCWTSGVFTETGIPSLTVHDELDFSDEGGRDAAFKEMHHILENAIKLRIPVRADCDIGPDWGHVEEMK